MKKTNVEIMKKIMSKKNRIAFPLEPKLKNSQSRNWKK